jgi:type I restriction enzyme M protein
MLLDELNELFDGIKLSKEIEKRLEKVCDTPEGDVEAKWVHKLISHYMYSPKQIAMQVPAGAGRNAAKNVVWADIVIYRDKNKKEPFIVVEAKEPKSSLHAGVKQAESYARNLGAEYHVCSNWIESQFYKTAKYIDQCTKVGNIPTWSSGQPKKEYLSKIHVLPPFKDEDHLRSVVKKCHDKIFFNLGHDPAKSFDELMKMLFLKMYDERVTPNEYQFSILPEQNKEVVATHIRALFKKAVTSPRYSDVFTTRFLRPGQNISLDLDDDTINFIVKNFQDFSLVNTTSTLEGVDIKGTVFERMVGSTFRGELGAYFTPRELVEFCIRLINPDQDDRVLDPSCGSGGFLIMVIKHITEKIMRGNPNLNEAEISSAVKNFSEHNIFGVDINERMVRVTKMNMIMHGDGHAGIYNSHGLNIGASDRLPIMEGSIDKIFSNPPFAGRESDPKYLARFETAKTEDGSIISLHKTIPFVEMIIKLLAPEGVAALVLPNGIFNSPSSTFKKLRKIIFEDTQILAVIGLPHWVFFHTGCDVQGSLLFLKKTTPTKDYNVFIDWADNVGYDAKGSKTKDNDLPSILDRYNKKEKTNLFKFSDLKRNDRFDALFYKPGKHTEFFSKPRKTKLADLVEPSPLTISKSKKNKGKYKYLEVGGVDPKTGKILKLQEYSAEDLPSRAKYIVRTGMVLLPNHRNSIAAKRAPVLITEEYDGIVVTSRFIPFYCRVPSSYVFHILNLDVTKEKMLTMVTGSSSTEIKWEVIKELPVPMPPNNDFDTFLADVIELESKIEQHEKLLKEKTEALNVKFTNLFH